MLNKGIGALWTCASIGLLSCIPMRASAWDGVVTGQVWRIDGAGAGNYPFRVIMAGGPAFCNGENWAYLSDSDGAYKTNAALLLSAKLTQATVSVYVTKDAAGHCAIGYIMF